MRVRFSPDSGVNFCGMEKVAVAFILILASDKMEKDQCSYRHPLIRHTELLDFKAFFVPRVKWEVFDCYPTSES